MIGSGNGLDSCRFFSKPKTHFLSNIENILKERKENEKIHQFFRFVPVYHWNDWWHRLLPV
jgi:hypothetical protein